MQQSRDVYTTSLVQWSYSRNEWKSFQRLHNRKKGWLPYLIHLAWFSRTTTIPIISITKDRISINAKEEVFTSFSRQLTRIGIREKQNLNLLEICYRCRDKGPCEITVPIPKGKLKEAIAVEEELNRIRLIPPGLLL